VQYESKGHRPFGDALERAPFVDECKNGMDRGDDVRGQSCQE
jgi:hypothetical protein